MTLLRALAPWPTASLLASTLVSGCIVSADLGDAVTESSSSDASTGSSTTPNTSGVEGSESGTGDDGATGPLPDPTTGGASESGEDPSFFSCPPDAGEIQCSLEDQDCPDGFHCIPWALDDGDDEYDATVCALLVESPVARFEPCQIHPVCTDDCSVGDYCLVGPEGQGQCVGLCDGEGDDDTCNTGEVCDTCADCGFGTCFEGCDPIAPDCPPEAPLCARLNGEVGYSCIPGPQGSGGLGEPCELKASCSVGLECINAEVLNGCGGPLACCTELCDLDDGDPGCSNPAHACVDPFWPETPPAGQEHVGICILPEFDPCLTPGNCPPAGVDDSVPWCSLSNEANCPETSLAGFFNGVACEQTCTCELPCEDVSDCPMPVTGTATAECVTEPFGVGSPTSCMYSCDGGEVCPDGMTCSDALSIDGHDYCVWVSPAPPMECI